MKNITVIGAGTMGNGIAHVFAQKGFNVSLFDIAEASLEKGLATIAKNHIRFILIRCFHLSIKLLCKV